MKNQIVLLGLLALCTHSQMSAASPQKSIYHKGWIDFNKNGVMDIYEDPKAPLEDRVQDLLSQMTLDEKTCQMATLYGSGRILKDALPQENWKTEIWKDGIGNIDEEHNGLGKFRSEYAFPYTRHVDTKHAIQRWFIEETRLGIPVDFTNEGIRGLCHDRATYFPAQCGQGATWNKELIARIAEVEAREADALGYTNIYSPILDISQDPRWGRCVETYGEDPYLVGQLGKQMVTTLQKHNLVATPKHFAVYSIPVGGRDGQTRTDPHVAPREMRTLYLEPFRVAFQDAGALGVMSSYNDYDGEPISGSYHFLTEILRQEWGFNGFIVSDCGAIGNLTARKHYTAKDKIEAANQALAAGIATNCGDTYNNKEVIQAAKDGRINMEDLDNVCRTMLSTMFRNELFEKNPCKPLDWKKIYPGWNSDSHKEMARQAARESIVMLENKENLLPLSKTLRTIAVVGPGADDLQPGDYTPKLLPGQLKSVLTGIKGAVGKQTKVLYEQGCDFTNPDETNIPKAVKAASLSDVVIMVLGDCSTSEATNDVRKTCGENNDWATLILPGKQQELLEAVCATGKPVILILQAGRPYDILKASEMCKAILVNWLPGQEGGPAMADVLFGDYNPAGRLPMTFPRHVGQLPLYYNFKTSGRRYEYVDMEYYPLYRFGFGLSYTSFEYSNLKIQEKANGNVEVQATVKNVGSRAGDEVAQLYVTDMYASVKTRVMELKDFARIHLQPGESKTVSFEMTPYDISLLNDRMDRVVEKGEFKIMVGGMSPDYVAKNEIKHSVGYSDNKKGVMGMLNYTHEFGANFDLTVSKIEENLVKNQKTVWVSVKNTGTLMDIGKVEMFVDGKKVGDAIHYELGAGEEKLIPFKLAKENKQPVAFTTKYKMVSM